MPAVSRYEAEMPGLSTALLPDGDCVWKLNASAPVMVCEGEITSAAGQARGHAGRPRKIQRRLQRSGGAFRFAQREGGLDESSVVWIRGGSPSVGGVLADSGRLECSSAVQYNTRKWHPTYAHPTPPSLSFCLKARTPKMCLGRA